MGQQQVVSCLQAFLPARVSWGVFTDLVTEKGCAPRFIMRDPRLNPVPQSFNDRLRISDEGANNVSGCPPSALVQGEREIPVVERDMRLDLVLKQFIDESVVKIQAEIVDCTITARNDPWPCHRKSVSRHP